MFIVSMSRLNKVIAIKLAGQPEPESHTWVGPYTVEP